MKKIRPSGGKNSRRAGWSWLGSIFSLALIFPPALVWAGSFLPPPPPEKPSPAAKTGPRVVNRISEAVPPPPPPLPARPTGTVPAPPAAPAPVSPAKPPSTEARPVSPEPSRAAQVKDVTLPPPQAVPAFPAGARPELTLETVRRGREIEVKGSTNLAVEGNGVRVSLFRVFRPAPDRPEERAVLASRDLRLGFEGRFRADDLAWLKAWAEGREIRPDVFSGLGWLDKERVMVEVLFTAAKADPGPVPGLSRHPIPGSDKMVYRIIRPLALGLKPEAERLLVRERAPAERPRPAAEVKARPPAPAAPAIPAGLKTKILILPLKWTGGTTTSSPDRPGPDLARLEP